MDRARKGHRRQIRRFVDFVRVGVSLAQRFSGRWHKVFVLPLTNRCCHRFLYLNLQIIFPLQARVLARLHPSTLKLQRLAGRGSTWLCSNLLDGSKRRFGPRWTETVDLLSFQLGGRLLASSKKPARIKSCRMAVSKKCQSGKEHLACPLRRSRDCLHARSASAEKLPPRQASVFFSRTLLISSRISSTRHAVVRGASCTPRG